MKLLDYKYKKIDFDEFFEITFDEYKSNLFGSYLLIDDKNVLINCSEDIYRSNSTGRVLKKSMNQLINLANIVLKMKYDNCAIYNINAYDYLIMFENGFQLVIFTDKYEHAITNYDYPMVKLKDTYFFNELEKINNKKIINIRTKYYEEYENICLVFDGIELTIYSLVKIIKNKEQIFISYKLRDKGNQELIKWNPICNCIVKKVVAINDYIYKLILTENIEFYIFIDNRYRYFKEVAIKIDKIETALYINDNGLYKD